MMVGRFAAIAVAALATVGAAGAAAKTYTFVNAATNQQIQVRCSADPRQRSKSWWQSNCQPIGQIVPGWSNDSAAKNHPDFLWLPTGSIGSGDNDDKDKD